MTTKALNSWFNNLDTDTLGMLFPGEFNEAMASADPTVNVNTFIKEVKTIWKGLTKEEKEEMYNLVEEDL